MKAMEGFWFCETCDRAITDGVLPVQGLVAHTGHDMTHFSNEDLSRALREFLPTLKQELQQ